MRTGRDGLKTTPVILMLRKSNLARRLFQVSGLAGHQRVLGYSFKLAMRVVHFKSCLALLPIQRTGCYGPRLAKGVDNPGCFQRDSCFGMNGPLKHHCPL